MAEKLEDAVAQAASMTPPARTVKLGISIGCATCPNDSRQASDLLEVADRRLYDHEGRTQGYAIEQSRDTLMID